MLLLQMQSGLQKNILDFTWYILQLEELEAVELTKGGQWRDLDTERDHMVSRTKGAAGKQAGSSGCVSYEEVPVFPAV